MKKQYSLWIVSMVFKGRRTFFQEGGAYGELWKEEPFDAKFFKNKRDAELQIAQLEKHWVPYYTGLHKAAPVYELFQIEMKINKSQDQNAI